MRILVAEDEVKTALMIKQGLDENGYETDIAFDGEAALALYRQNNYHLIVTDIIMPKLTGLELCKIIRTEKNSPPIIMLTALGMTTDKISGFNAGTDDYLVKPFEFEELIARIKAIVKRTYGTQSPTNQLTFADLVINLDSKEVTRAGNTISLTAKEFMLLLFLIKNKGRVISKADIAENVWDVNFDTGTNVVEVYVNYLRNKIDKNYPTKLIHTKIGMGYILKEA
jgi:two-component system copper resistance phosphate regulon response regulator CusR